MILVCAGCTTMKTYNQQAQTFANDLERANDPIKTVEQYKEYKKLKCTEYDAKKRKDDMAGWYVFKYIWLLPFGLAYDGIDSIYDFTTSIDEACLKQAALAEKDINFACIESWREGDKHYNSDECVLYRRSEQFHKSDVNYFDYKRFLGENSVIKNDADFLKLVKYYDKIAECDKLKESTTTEKEECKEKCKTEMRALAVKKVPCNKLISEKYNKFIAEQKEWFYWAQNHDPYAMVNTLRAFGEYEAARFAYSPVVSRGEAISTIKERVKEFGEENFCTTDDWKQKIGIK